MDLKTDMTADDIVADIIKAMGMSYSDPSAHKLDALIRAAMAWAGAEHSIAGAPSAEHVDLNEAAMVDALVDIDLIKREAVGLLYKLVKQIELVDFTDQHGQKLTTTVAFIKAKEALGE